LRPQSSPLVASEEEKTNLKQSFMNWLLSPFRKNSETTHPHERMETQTTFLKLNNLQNRNKYLTYITKLFSSLGNNANGIYYFGGDGGVEPPSFGDKIGITDYRLCFPTTPIASLSYEKKIYPFHVSVLSFRPFIIHNIS